MYGVDQLARICFSPSPLVGTVGHRVFYHNGAGLSPIHYIENALRESPLPQVRVSGLALAVARQLCCKAKFTFSNVSKS